MSELNVTLRRLSHCLTKKIPHVKLFNLKSVICPAAELHIAHLVIKREPCDVYLAGRLEYSWWDVGARSTVCYNNIGWKSTIKLLIGTKY